ncbi:MAG: hypothetical protein HYY32_04385 [Chloroflexi bacterium]|nr:hypothetical protein [Chloroflexota bacterium]
MDRAVTETVARLAVTEPATYAVMSVAAIALFAFAAYGTLLLLSRVVKLRWPVRH